MRIGVDGACWANQRGYGRFAREVVAAMANAAPSDEFVCFVDEVAKRYVPSDAPNIKLVLVNPALAPTEAAASDRARSPLDMLRFTRAVWRARLDVFFSPSVYTYFPLPPGLPAVVTIHDAIAERFPSLTLPSRRARLFWKLKVATAVHQSRLILTVSEYARREVRAVHAVPDSRIRVALEAPAAAYRPAEDLPSVATAARATGIPEGQPWFMYVGGFNPHKNVDQIVRAHARYARSLPEGSAPHLVLAGSTAGDVFYENLAEIRSTITKVGTGPLVHWPGFVPDEELALLLSGALGSLLVSEAEGFGLPAVEAAACGCPVIATTESPLPELLEGGGLFVRPGDEDGIVAAMERFAEDEQGRARMATIALQRAGTLSWPKAAASVLGALYEAAG